MTLLSSYLLLSRKVPGTAPDLWIAQSFVILCRLFPGDKEVAQNARARGWKHMYPDW